MSGLWYSWRESTVSGCYYRVVDGLWLAPKRRQPVRTYRVRTGIQLDLPFGVRRSRSILFTHAGETKCVDL